MLITSTVDICIQQLDRVEEMVLTTQHSYASTVLGVIILSVCHTLALWTNPKKLLAIFNIFFVQLCSS